MFLNDIFKILKYTVCLKASFELWNLSLAHLCRIKSVYLNDNRIRSSFVTGSALHHFIFGLLLQMNSCFQTLSTRAKAALRGLFPRQQHQTLDDSMSECILQFSNVPRNCYLWQKHTCVQNETFVRINFISVRQIPGMLISYCATREKRTFLCHLMCLILAVIVIMIIRYRCVNNQKKIDFSYSDSISTDILERNS